MKAWLRRSVWLCLSLLLWTVALESTHHHPSQADASTCSVCVAAHTASPARSINTSPTFDAIGFLPGNDCPASTTLPDGSPGIAMFANGAPMTADQEFEAGLFCVTVRATPTVALPSTCPVTQFGSSLVRVPAAGTQNDDKNPVCIAPRHLFDASIGNDNLFHGDKHNVSLQLTAINLTNQYALYNFLSTFTGTHYVTPRSLTAEVGFHF